MPSRAEIIQGWINSRKAQNQTCKAIFYITVPHIPDDIGKDEQMILFSEMLERNNVPNFFVDTIPGAWNLNRDWIETEPVECIIEYCGVYPVNWNIDDVVMMEELETEGKIIISVFVNEDGKYVPNH